LKRAKTDPSLESGPMRERGSAGTSESKERVCESLNGPISLALDVLFFYAAPTKSRGHINLPLSVRSSVRILIKWFVRLSPPTVLELQL